MPVGDLCHEFVLGRGFAKNAEIRDLRHQSALYRRSLKQTLHPLMGLWFFTEAR